LGGPVGGTGLLGVDGGGGVTTFARKSTKLNLATLCKSAAADNDSFRILPNGRRRRRKERPVIPSIAYQLPYYIPFSEKLKMLSNLQMDRCFKL
jgi:hypothetical protein